MSINKAQLKHVKSHSLYKLLMRGVGQDENKSQVLQLDIRLDYCYTVNQEF